MGPGFLVLAKEKGYGIATFAVGTGVSPPPAEERGRVSLPRFTPSRELLCAFGKPA
jgi:hypothetical protein